MILHLKVEVPNSMPEDEALRHLILARAKGEGITIITAQQHHMDVDLVDVERGL